MRDFDSILENSKKRLNTIRNKWLQFLDYKYAAYFIAAALCILVGLVVSLVLQMFPFGDRSILTVDLYHQYAPFIQELQRKLKSFEDLFFTWNVGLGINYFAVAAYYTLSPFNLLLFFLPQSSLPFNIWLIINLKILAITLAGVAFLRYFYQERRTIFWHKLQAQMPFYTDYAQEVELSEQRQFRRRLQLLLQIFLPLFFAWSGYVCAYIWNLMWLDGVFALPLMALGICKIVRERKPWVYLLSLAYSITFNYYTAIFNCLFAALYSLLVIYDEWQFKRQELKFADTLLTSKVSEADLPAYRSFLNKVQVGPSVIANLIDFTILSLLGGLMSSPLLLPVLSAFSTSSAAGDKWPTSHAFRHSFMEILERFLAFAKVNIRSGAPNIYFGLFALICLALLLYRIANMKYALLAKLTLVVFIGIGFSSNVLNFIWHGLHYPNQIPHRFAYVFIFICLQLLYELFVDLRRSDALYLFIGAVWTAFCIFIFQFYGTVEEMPQYQLSANLLLALAYVAVTGLFFYALSKPNKLEVRLQKLQRLISLEKAAWSERGLEPYMAEEKVENSQTLPEDSQLPAAPAAESALVAETAAQTATETAVATPEATPMPLTAMAEEEILLTESPESAGQAAASASEAGIITVKRIAAPEIAGAEDTVVSNEPPVRRYQMPALSFLETEAHKLEQRSVNYRQRQRRALTWVSYLLPLLLTVELCANAATQISNLHASEHLTSDGNYKSRIVSKQQTVAAIKGLENNNMYRVESFPPKTIDDGALYGFYGITAFSSASNKFTAETMRRLGLHGNNINSYKVNMPLNIFSDLFGAKYFISEDAPKDGQVLQNAYLNWQKLDNAALGIAQDDVVWQNPDALNIAFLADEALFDFKLSSNVPYVNYNQFTAECLGYDKYMADFSTGEADTKQALFEPVSYQLLQQINSTWEQENNYFNFKAVAPAENAEENKERKVQLHYTAQEATADLSLFAEGSGRLTVNFKVFDSNMNEVTADSANAQVTLLKQLTIGAQEAMQFPLLAAGQTLELTLTLDKDDSSFKVYLAKQNAAVKDALLTFLKGRELNLQRVNNTKMEIALARDYAALSSNADNLAAMSVLALTVPFDKGWNLTVDGQVAEKRSWLNISEHSQELTDGETQKFEQEKGAFLAFVLPKPLQADSVLKLTYTPTHFNLGLLLSLFAVVVSIAYAAYLAKARNEVFGGYKLWHKLNSYFTSKIKK